MEPSFQSFDVCVVCALPEEARAFLEVIQQQCTVAFEKRISAQYKYDYQSATIQNDENESLSLHVSWLPRYGPQEMTLHLTRLLEECQPRIAIMTGVCAGDAQRVQLGDLVVADRTFTYDNGKFMLDEHGRSVYLHDTMTYQLDANILQFLGLFDDWKPLVADLERPPSSPEQREIACHVKAVASGSTVRADHSFEDIRAPVRGTVAIDMEGAAFGLVMSRHPLVPWLVVKGVCDYADKTKNDTYHDYAARASALYALSFIRAYVTNERLPRPDRHRGRPSEVWNVPYRRNLYFTGRDELLDRLNQQFSSATQDDLTTTRRAALTQPQAIKGLGGIGKTQIAVEFAYRSRDQGHYTHTLWVNAASEETIITSFVTIAEVLPAFSAKNETNQRKLVEAVKRWLELCEHRWLLIFDNIDNADDLPIIPEYLPRWGNGSILLTTRAHAVGSLAASIEVEKMSLMEGSCLLLRRVYGLASHLSPMQVLEHASVEDTNEAGNIVAALDYLPLALDQAGAYIEETGCGFAGYLEVYNKHHEELLKKRGKQITDYPDAVATTWSASFEKVEQANPAAAELLRLCAFLAPDTIPEDLIRDGAVHWSSPLHRAATDSFTFNQMVEDLLKFSLIKRLDEVQTLKTLRIHRLVQAVQRDEMKPEGRRQWAERVVRAVDQVFPAEPNDITALPKCRRYLDQVQACSTLIEDYELILDEGANLLDRASIYLDGHALYSIAEPLEQRAQTIREQLLKIPLSKAALSKNTRAEHYRSQGQYKKAESLYLLALADFERVDPTHTDTAVCISNLALLYSEMERYDKAEPLCLRALPILEQELGDTDPKTVSCINNLANIYYRLKKHDKAEPLYVRALAGWDQQEGIPVMAISLNNLGELYRIQKRDEEAKPLFQRAQAIFENYEKESGEVHPNFANTLNNLALLYHEQEKYKEAEPLYERALKIFEQNLKDIHPDKVGLLSNLANLYYKQGKYEEAKPLLKRAHLSYEQIAGATDPYTQGLRKGYISLLRAMGCDEEARDMEERS